MFGPGQHDAKNVGGKRANKYRNGKEAKARFRELVLAAKGSQEAGSRNQAYVNSNNSSFCEYIGGG